MDKTLAKMDELLLEVQRLSNGIECSDGCRFAGRIEAIQLRTDELLDLVYSLISAWADVCEY